MENNSTTPTKAPALEKLERVRGRVRTVTRTVEVTEGRLLDFDTADSIHRTLGAAARELEELIVAVAVMIRKGGAL